MGKQSEPKIWNNTWFTKSNPNILLCRKAKQAINLKKTKLLNASPKILRNFCVGEQSEPKNLK